MHKIGRPVLVGTTSVEQSDALSEQLREAGIPHEVSSKVQIWLESKDFENYGLLFSCWFFLYYFKHILCTIKCSKLVILQRFFNRHCLSKVLNAKPENVEREAEIVAQSGRLGAVTIATNMAGRGTDIILGGNAEFMARLKLREILMPRLLLHGLFLFSWILNRCTIECYCIRIRNLFS